MADPALGAARLSGFASGADTFSKGGFLTSEARQASDPTVGSLDYIAAKEGAAKNHAADLIPQGEVAAARALETQMHPLQKILQDNYDQQIEQATILRTIRDDQSFIRRQYEKLRHPFTNANMQAIDADDSVRANNGQPDP